MKNISFNVGEIIWAKIRGYPWWPAIITGTEDDNREKKYAVSFIGDNTHSSLTKKCLYKFEKGLKSYSNTKKRNLLESIERAKEIYYNKNGIKNREIKYMMKSDIKYSENGQNKDKQQDIDKNNTNKDINNQDLNHNEMLNNNKRKLKKLEDKTENELIYKICHYLKLIIIMMSNKENNYNFEKNKENLIKITYNL